MVRGFALGHFESFLFAVLIPLLSGKNRNGSSTKGVERSFLNHGFHGWAQMGSKPNIGRVISVPIRGIRD